MPSLISIVREEDIQTYLYEQQREEARKEFEYQERMKKDQREWDNWQAGHGKLDYNGLSFD